MSAVDLVGGVGGAEGTVIWDMPAYGFVDGEAPESVNPSLWRQARLNNIHGLFEVTKGVYQLRGYDLANMSLIEGQTGWIVVDPLTAEETARAAIAFPRTPTGDKPVGAVCSHLHPQPHRPLRGGAGHSDTRGS